jgi:hypothetical protein
MARERDDAIGIAAYHYRRRGGISRQLQPLLHLASDFFPIPIPNRMQPRSADMYLGTVRMHRVRFRQKFSLVRGICG